VNQFFKLLNHAAEYFADRMLADKDCETPTVYNSVGVCVEAGQDALNRFAAEYKYFVLVTMKNCGPVLAVICSEDELDYANELVPPVSDWYEWFNEETDKAELLHVDLLYANGPFTELSRIDV
jgi:hypothetical protein